MCKAYGIVPKEPKKVRGLQRVSSRGSVRSNHSATPIMRRNIPQLEEIQPPEEIFDEEKEQEQLEELKKRKERAKKMREQQEKMLAEIQLKKEREMKEQEDKNRKYEKKLAKAREECKVIFKDLPEKPKV